MARQPYPYHRIAPRPGSPFHQVLLFLEPGKRPVRKSTGEIQEGPAREAGRRLFIEHLTKTGKVPPDLSGEVRLEGLCEAYLAERERTADGVEAYLDGLEQTYRTRLLPSFTTVGDLTTAAWEKVKDGMRADGLTWATVAKHTIYVKTMLEWAVETKRLPEAPHLELPSKKAIRREETKRRALTDEEKGLVLWALAILATESRRPGEGAEALRWYIVAFATCMRKSEINALKRRWINFDAGLITIPAADQKGADTTPPIDMPADAAEAIKAQLATLGTIAPGAVVFPRKEHRKAWAAACRMAGIDMHGVTPHHTARHTGLTEIARSGDVLAVQIQGRHKSLSTSMGYVHVGVEQVRRARAQAQVSVAICGDLQPSGQPSTRTSKTQR